MFKVYIYLKHAQLFPTPHRLSSSNAQQIQNGIYIFCIWFQNENVDLNFQFSKKKTIKTKQQIFCYLLNSLFVLCPQSKRHIARTKASRVWSTEERCGHSCRHFYHPFCPLDFLLNIRSPSIGDISIDRNRSTFLHRRHHHPHWTWGCPQRRA